MTIKCIVVTLIVLMCVAIGTASASTVNVAVGDDIQTAINGASAGDTIFLASGTHTIDECLIINKTIMLTGNDDSVLFLADDTELETIPMILVAANNVEICGFEIEPNYAGNNDLGTGASIGGVPCNIVILFNGQTYAADNGYVHDMYIHDSGGDLIKFLYSDNGVVDNCTLETPGHEAVYAWACNGLTVTNSYIEQSCNSGVRMGATRNVLIDSNVFVGEGGYYAIQMETSNSPTYWPCNNYTITYNSFTGCTAGAIMIDGSGSAMSESTVNDYNISYNTISGSVLYQSQTDDADIAIMCADDVDIGHNTFYNSGAAANIAITNMEGSGYDGTGTEYDINIHDTIIYDSGSGYTVCFIANSEIVPSNYNVNVWDCDLVSTTGEDTSNGIIYTDNIDTDPLFANTTTFELQSSSPCISTSFDDGYIGAIAPTSQDDPEESNDVSITNLTVLNDRAYVLNTMNIGELFYVNRAYVVSSIPSSYIGLDYIETATSEIDRLNTSDEYMSFDVNRTVNVYVAYDDRIATLPTWLSTWNDTGDNVVRDSTYPFSMYKQTFAAGTVTLGGCSDTNNEGGMYIVLIEATNETAPRSYITITTSGVDGTADEVEINAAIQEVYSAGGGTVYLDSGTYCLSGSLQFAPGVSLIGESDTYIQ